MQKRITQIILEQLRESEGGIEALDALKYVEFFRENEGRIRELFEETPVFLDAVVNTAEVQQQKASEKPQNINVVLNHTRRKMQVIFPTTNRNSNGYKTLKEALNNYPDVNEVTNGPYTAIELNTPRSERAERTLEEELQTVLTSLYPSTNVVISHTYRLDLGTEPSHEERFSIVPIEEPIGRTSRRPRTRRKQGQRDTTQRYFDVGDDYFEVEITASEVKYKILRFPRVARSLLPGYKVPFYLNEGGKQHEVLVSSAKTGTQTGDTLAGNYISGLSNCWSSLQVRPGDKVRIEKVKGDQYQLSKV